IIQDFQGVASEKLTNTTIDYMGGFSTAYLFDFVVRIVSGKDDFQTIEGSEYLCLDAGEEGNLIFDVFPLSLFADREKLLLTLPRIILSENVNKTVDFFIG
ncbi:MAG TPA: hypothetical protein PLK86_05710, partial [Bacilli bacterium]|nr:hypothetical protein [Bacilli bacterium]